MFGTLKGRILVILAVVSALVTAGTVSPGLVAWIVAKSFLFLAGAVVAGA